MNQLIRKLSLAMLIIMLVLMISDIFSIKPVHGEPSLPIVSEEGIYSIEVYPLRHELIVYAQ
ncbi:hypothetical protein D3C80_2055520 [compost metagenome]